MLRKLLYHRGIDDEISTYVSDYVTGSLCLLFGVVTLFMAAAVARTKRKTRGWMKAQEDGHKTRGNSRCAEICAVDLRANVARCDQIKKSLHGMRNDSSNAVRGNVRRLEAVAMVKAIFGLLFTACGAMLILGGMTHGQVQQVHVSLWHDEDGPWSDDTGTEEAFAANTVRKLEAYLSLYVTWQFANICGGLVASLFVLSVPFTIAREATERREVSRSRSGSGVISRSRSSTNNSVALLVSSLRAGDNSCRRGGGARRSLKATMQALALVLAIASVTYHAWNVVSYLGAIQVDRAALDRIRSDDGRALDAADTATGRNRSPPPAATFALESEGDQENIDVLLDDFAGGETRNVSSASSSLLYDFFLDLRKHFAVRNESLNETSPPSHKNSPYGETTVEAPVAISPLENGSDFRPFDFSSMWGMAATSPLLGLAVFIYACFVTYLALRVLRRGADDEESACCCCECQDSMQEICGCWTDVAAAEDSASDAAENAKPGLVTGLKSSRKTATCCAFSPLLVSSCVRFFAAWVLLASGLIQFGFSSKCGGEQAMAELGCPFPDHFNHNSIYHVSMGLALTMLFFTEAFSPW